MDKSFQIPTDLTDAQLQEFLTKITEMLQVKEDEKTEYDTQMEILKHINYEELYNLFIGNPNMDIDNYFIDKGINNNLVKLQATNEFYRFIDTEMKKSASIACEMLKRIYLILAALFKYILQLIKDFLIDKYGIIKGSEYYQNIFLFILLLLVSIVFADDCIPQNIKNMIPNIPYIGSFFTLLRTPKSKQYIYALFKTKAFFHGLHTMLQQFSIGRAITSSIIGLTKSLLDYVSSQLQIFSNLVITTSYKNYTSFCKQLPALTSINTSSSYCSNIVSNLIQSILEFIDILNGNEEISSQISALTEHDMYEIESFKSESPRTNIPLQELYASWKSISSKSSGSSESSESLQTFNSFVTEAENSIFINSTTTDAFIRAITMSEKQLGVYPKTPKKEGSIRRIFSAPPISKVSYNVNLDKGYRSDNDINLHTIGRITESAKKKHDAQQDKIKILRNPELIQSEVMPTDSTYGGKRKTKKRKSKQTKRNSRRLKRRSNRKRHKFSRR
jgi:hypothetical protein